MSMPAKRCAVVSVCLAAAIFTACSPSETPPPATAATTSRVYEMRGIIMQLGTAKAARQLVIHHEATKNMESMTMPFAVDEGVSLAGLAVGDKVSFRFEVDLNTDMEHVTKIEKLPADTQLNLPGTPAASPATSTAPAGGMPPMPGM